MYGSVLAPSLTAHRHALREGKAGRWSSAGSGPLSHGFSIHHQQTSEERPLRTVSTVVTCAAEQVECETIYQFNCNVGYQRPLIICILLYIIALV